MLLIAESDFQSDIENREAKIFKQFLTSLDAEPKHVLVGTLILCLHEIEMRNEINSGPHSQRGLSNRSVCPCLRA